MLQEPGGSPRRIARAILIGLGTAGYEVCLELAHQLHARLQKDPGSQFHPGVIHYICLFSPAEPQTEDKKTEVLGEVKVSVPSHLEPFFTLLELPPLSDPRAAVEWWEQHYGEFGRKLHQVSGQVRRRDVVRVLRDGHLELRHPGHLEYFIVGSLGDPLCSGLLGDLAVYLMAQEQIEQNNPFAFINALLFLPNFPAQQPDRGDQTDQYARAYAALKELDHLMGLHPYRREYPDGYEIHLSPQEHPFMNGQCFVVGGVNQRGEVIPWNEAMRFAADWCYYLLATPAGEQMPLYSSQGGVAAFGLASYVLPWSSLVEHCGARLTAQLLDQVLLAPRDRTNIQTELDLLRVKLGLHRETVDEKVQESVEIPAYLRRTQSGHTIQRMPAFPLLDMDTFEQKLLVEDNEHLRRLDGLHNQLVERCRELVENLFQDLQREIDQLLARHVCGGIDMAIDILRALESQAENVLEAERAQQEELQQARQRLSREIEEARGRYRHGVHALSPLRIGPLLAPMTPVALALIGGVITWLWVQGLSAWTGAGVWNPNLWSLIGLLLVLGATLYWWRLTRSAQVTWYERFLQRQQKDLECEFLEARIYVWEHLMRDIRERWVPHLQGLRNSLLSLHREVRENRERAIQQKLYDSPRHPQERSVLTPELVERFYREEVALDRPDDQLHELEKYTGQPYYRWMLQDKAQILSDIQHYARNRAGRLRHHTVISVLRMRYGSADEKDEGSLPENLARLLDESSAMADPSLKLKADRLALDAISEIVAIYRLERNSGIARYLRSRPAANEAPRSLILIDDPDELVWLQLHTDIPLHNIGGLEAFHRAYQRMLQTMPAPYRLHSRDEYLLLPDLESPEQEWKALDPGTPLELSIHSARRVFVLARFLDLLQADEQGRYVLHYWTPQDRRLLEARPDQVEFLKPHQLVLGTSHYMAVYNLYKPPYMLGIPRHRQPSEETVLEYLRGQVRQTLRQRLQEVWHGDEIELALALRRYVEEYRNTLETWEEEELLSFYRLILYRHPPGSETGRIRTGQAAASAPVS